MRYLTVVVALFLTLNGPVFALDFSNATPEQRQESDKPEPCEPMARRTPKPSEPPNGYTMERKYLSDQLFNMRGIETIVKNMCNEWRTRCTPDPYLEKRDPGYSLACKAEAIGEAQEALSNIYPGMNISCLIGGGTLVTDNTKLYFSNFNIYKLEKDLGNAVYTISPETHIARVADGSNYVVWSYDTDDPHKTVYIDAQLPIVAETAEMVLPKQHGREAINFQDRGIIKMLNEIYPIAAEGIYKQTHIVFAYSLLTVPSMREEFVKEAADIYTAQAGTLRKPTSEKVAHDKTNKWFDLGNDFYSKGQMKAAIDAYSKAIKQEPNNPDYFTARGKAYAKKGNLKAAQKDFDTADKLAGKGGNSNHYAGKIKAPVEKAESVKAAKH